MVIPNIVLEGREAASHVWDSPDVLDRSEIAAYAECPRKFFYRYLLALRELEVSPALDYGVRLHIATSEIRRGASAEDAYTKAFDDFEEPEKPWGRTRVVAAELARQYHKWWTSSPYEVVILGDNPTDEIGFAVPYNDSVVVTGRIDCIIHDTQLDVYRVLDDKSSSRLSNSWWRTWEVDNQVSAYVLAAQHYIPQVKSMTIRALLVSDKVVGRIVYKGQKREEYRQGEQAIFGNIYERNAWQLETHRIDFGVRAKEIREGCIKLHDEAPDIAEAYWLRNTAACCNRYQKVCPYLDICANGLCESPIEGGFKVEAWKPFEEVRDENSK